jgi:hypothetical protein
VLRPVLLGAVSRFPSPRRDALRASLSVAVDLDVLAVLLRTAEADLRAALVAAAGALQPRV